MWFLTFSVCSACFSRGPSARPPRAAFPLFFRQSHTPLCVRPRVTCRGTAHCNVSFVGTQVDGVGLGARRQVPRGAPRRGAERAAPHVPAWGDRRHTSPGRYNEHPEVQNSIHDILLFLCRKGFDTHGHANVCEKSTSEHEKLSQKARGNGTAWGGGRGAGGQEWRRRSRGRTVLPRPSFGNLRVFCLIKNKDKTSTPKY